MKIDVKLSSEPRAIKELTIGFAYYEYVDFIAVLCAAVFSQNRDLRTSLPLDFFELVKDYSFIKAQKTAADILHQLNQAMHK